MSLADLKFSNLYISTSTDLSYLVNTEKQMLRENDLDEISRNQMRELFGICQQRFDHTGRVKPDFGLVFENMPFRVAALQTQTGDMFMLRRLSSQVASLSALRFPEAFIPHLTAPRISGLVLIAGPMNSGKSTTIASIIHDILSTHGGVAVTIEDPIEIPLEGPHGNGVCFQTEIESGGCFAPAIRTVMRSGADIIMIGELRDNDEAANEALAAAVNGHMVIASIHADDIPRTISRMKALVTSRFQGSAADTLLADGLYGVVHQQLRRAPNTAPRLEVECLIVRKSISAQSHIRRGAHEMLLSEIKQQEAVMIMENAQRRQKPAGAKQDAPISVVR